MYRIELSPDEIGVYRSIEEMATAIKTGALTSRARIYHQATDKWLPIEFHPHYKKALALVASGRVQTPTSELRFIDVDVRVPPPVEPPAAQEAPSAASEAPAEPTSEAPSQPIEPAAPGRRRWRFRRHSHVRFHISGARRVRRPFVLALAGVILVGTAEVGLSAAPPPWDIDIKLLQLPFRPGRETVSPAPSPAPKTEAALEPVPTFGPVPTPTASATESTSASLAAPAAAVPTPAAMAPPPAAIAPPPATIELSRSALTLATSRSPLGDHSVAGLRARYEAAYAAARKELDSGLRTAGFADLFARLGDPKAGETLRMRTATAAAYVRKYQARELEIEQAYRDTFDLLGRKRAWSAEERRAWETRPVLREHPEGVKLSRFLLQTLDRLFGLLGAAEGKYALQGGQLTFDDPAAARAYAELRAWLDRRAYAWADSAQGATTAARVLRAMGPNPLPQGQAF